MQQLLDSPVRHAVAGTGTNYSRVVFQQDSQLIAAWRNLAECTADALVDMHPEMVLTDVPSGPSTETDLVLYTSYRSGQLSRLAVLKEKSVSLPILPCLRCRMRLRGLRLVGSRLLGGDTFADVEAFAAELDPLLNNSTSRYSCLLLEDLPIESPWWRAMKQACHLQTITLSPLQKRWSIRVPDSAETYWKQFSSKTRYNFRRQKRLFDHQWVPIRDVIQIEEFLTQAATVSANSWQGKRLGVRVRREGPQFEQLRKLAELGALRCYLLRSGEVPVAFAIGTQFNGRFVLEEIGYDKNYSKYSPGTVLLLNMLDDMFQRDTPEIIDFGFGDGSYKQLFGNVSTESGALLVVSPRLGPSLATALSRAGLRTEQVLRKGLAASGLNAWIRKLYRR